MGLTADNITWLESPASARESFIQNGDVDMVVATYTINDASKERVTFAGPYYIAGQQLMIASNNAAIESRADLKANPRQKVCSVSGSISAEQIKPYLANLNQQLVTYDNNGRCATALSANEVQVVTSDSLILEGFVAKSDKAFKLVGDQSAYGIGIKKGDVRFCEFINRALKNNAFAYKQAWADSAGTADGSAPAVLPPAEACI